MESSHEILITDWFRRSRESQFVHYACGNFFSRLNYFLGVPTICLTGVVSTAIFSTLENEVVGSAKIVVGFVSVLATILASLQTFLGFSERAEKHRVTAARYAAVRRQLEFIKSFSDGDGEELRKKMEMVKQEMDGLAKSSPEVPERIWKKRINILKGEEHNRVFHLPAKDGLDSRPSAGE